ncbi:hypothetical protein H0E87_005939 [Populus deltoides]|uniref:Protein FAR1-RELATED SEQUENCE n=1 Tax=Populus deltoides TaxID=3696 RepID=A0A8T2Z510_POPDE|nr:hypothetical protein H0E87_005939 [Populus deltoides]
MDSSVITGSTIPEPRDGIEFESHEAAYSFYKDYAKSVGFGTAKLSSRRSRSSKEFIDAKFSCIRYGNKQQSDDAINPRPSPKIGCKASMHVKRRQNGKWKFQVEVLGAAACHLKKESQDETTTMYTVKDFEDGQNYVVEWNETKSDIYCSCRSFEYKGYLCRHAIVVLQMSGVFSIPPKYVLQRWTNAALSRHPISERLDEVQTKVRRYNDLCRRAIILGEEGSLSQESYNIALCAIREALKQCASLNNSAETSACPNTSGSIEEENQYRNTSKERAPDLQVTGADKATRRAGAANTKESNHSSAVKKGKVTRSGDVNVGGQEGFHLVGISDLGPTQSHNMMPAQLQNAVPTVFHNIMPTQFQNIASTHLHDTRLPR